MPLLIRKASLDEAALVHSVMMDAFAIYRQDVPPTSALNETVGSVRRMMEGGETGVLCFLDGEAVGSVRYLFRDGLYFHRLSVQKKTQGQGIGTAMVGWLEGEARRTGQRTIWLKVRSSQPRNIEWYVRQGYGRAGESDELNPNGDMVRTVRMLKALSS